MSEPKPVMSDEEITRIWESCIETLDMSKGLRVEMFARRLLAEFAERVATLQEQITSVTGEMAALSEKRGELEKTSYREGFSEGLKNAARIVREAAK